MTNADTPAQTRLSEGQKGIIFCAIAHLFWGGMALYFGLIRHISPTEIAVHRGLWSLPIAAAILWWLGGFGEVGRILANRRVMLTLGITSVLIVFNWAVYVWTIEVGRTLESSLGYYINPLFNVIAGYFFLGERFTRAQILAIGLAGLAVVIQTIGAGVFPWIGLLLGSTFCLYGFLRKTVKAGAVEGFFVETLIIAGPLFAYAVWLAETGQAHFLIDAIRYADAHGLRRDDVGRASLLRRGDQAHPLLDGGTHAIHLALDRLPHRRVRVRRAPRCVAALVVRDHLDRACNLHDLGVA